MRTSRSFLCALLTLIMGFSFCACDKSNGRGDKASATPAETGDTVSTDPTEDPADETSEGAAAVESLPPSPYDGRSDLVILNWDDYLNRPHEIQPGTVLNYAAPNDVPSQLPWNCGSDGWLTGSIYEGLLYMYMNDPEDIRGCIAKSWSHSDDYLTWTFQIRDGVMFTDRTVCDADAIATAWDYVREASPTGFSNCNVESWEAANEKELVVRLSAPCGWFETGLCGNELLVVSPTALDLYGTDDNQAAIGTGPYCIASYTSGERIVLKANSDYYLEEKMPCIETAIFHIIGNRDDTPDLLLNGGIDGAIFNSNYYASYSKSGLLKKYDYFTENGYAGHLVACLGPASALWFNADVAPVFETIEVREAMVRFIDLSAINDLIYDGFGAVQDSIWGKGASGYVRTDQFYYDPDEGQSLLASVGLAAADIVIETSIPEYSQDLFFAIRNQLLEAGVQLTLDVFGPESSFSSSWYAKRSSIIYLTIQDFSFYPYYPWSFVLLQGALIKACWQDIYDPDLYQKMLDEYDAMIAAATWDDMLTHSRQLTAYEQDDFGAIGGIQPPAFIALGKDFKNGVYFSADHDLQLYYLYQ